MLSNFANFWQKHTPGNLKERRMHSPPHLVLYVRSVPCKNWCCIFLPIIRKIWWYVTKISQKRVTFFSETSVVSNSFLC